MKNWIIALFVMLVSLTRLSGQTANAPSPTLESPYNTMYVHLHYLQPETYQPEIAAVTLFRIGDSIENIQNAIRLKQIFDGNGLFVRLNQLPQEQNYIDSTTQKPYFTPFPATLPDVYLEKIDNQWHYSAETVKHIRGLHQKTYPFGTDILLNLLPRMGHQLIFGLALWQYLAIAILLLLTWLVYKILSGLLLPFVRQILRKYLDPEKGGKLKLLKIAQAISMFLLSRLVRLLIPVLQLPIEAMAFAITAINIISAVLMVVLVLRVLGLVMDYALRYAQTTEHKMDEQLIPILRRMFAVFVIMAGLIYILRLLEVNVTALIAGVSIGGLALALAAQDTVKNLIGSAMIFFDRPFQIGDYIVGSGFEGSVVEVGFRTTRIVLADTSILSVPNGTVANMIVTNKGMRVYRLFQTNLGLTYDTPPDLIEKFVQGLEQIVLNYPFTRKEDFYINLTALDASSLTILFRSYVEVSTYKEELQVKQDLLLAILRLAETIGVRFAFPSSTVYVEDFPEKKTNVPDYIQDDVVINEKLKTFLENLQHRYPKQGPDQA